MSQYRAYFVPGGVDPTGELLADPTGGQITVGVLGAILVTYYGCLGQFRAEAEAKWPVLDKMKHCYVSCRAARTCGSIPVFAAGNGKETIDAILETLKGTPQWEIVKDIYEDQEANMLGRGCAGFETGIPGAGLIFGWCRESCEDCCHGHGY